MEIIIDHKFQKLMPKLTTEEKRQLEENIVSEGCREPILLWRNRIIDGHNRYEICQKKNIPFETKSLNFLSEDDVRMWIIRNQFGRRNLQLYTRTELVLQIEPLLHKKAKENMIKGGKKKSNKGVQNSAPLPKIRTRDEIAKFANVSHDTVYKVKKIKENINEDLEQKLHQGEISIHQAFRTVRELEKKSHRKKLRMEQRSVDLPEGKYEIILADPPWKISQSLLNTPDDHYPCMDLEDIKKLKIPTADNALLFIWVVSGLLREALEVCESWGFCYKTNFVWVKKRIGLGYWLRNQHELLLICKKGNFPLPEPHERIPSVLHAKREIHSQKPKYIHEYIEKTYSNYSKCELFAREKRNGWYCWGNET